MSAEALVWSKALATPGIEFPLTPLPVVSGAIPDGLRGSLYRNGPARLERAGKRVGHWFDGDGAILGVHFADGAARGVYRYVQTWGSKNESQAERWLYGGYGSIAPGRIWERWGKPVKNAANTSVLALPDKLLALWEGGSPHALDLENLETIGVETLGSQSDRFVYSAHPKVDPKNGDIYNFGISVGAETKLNLYRSDRTGKIVCHTQTKLEGISNIHDFVLAGQYLVFLIPPVRVKVLPVLLRVKSYSDSMQWQPHLGTQILVFDREHLTLVSSSTVEPWFQWHIGNGYVDKDSNIVCSIAQYQDFATNQFLKEVASGTTQTLAISHLWELTIEPSSARLIKTEKLSDRGCEFPTVKQSEVGENWRYTYLSVHKTPTVNPQELLGTIGRYDRENHTLAIAPLDSHLYASEPIYAQDKYHPDRGWLLTVVYDGKNHHSEVWIYDSDRLDDEPICKLGLPSVIPMGFHGTWLSPRQN
jgi:carotenoid cleavage dioxygenase-like enzyme